jgi:hypothetical protein
VTAKRIAPRAADYGFARSARIGAVMLIVARILAILSIVSATATCAVVASGFRCFNLSVMMFAPVVSAQSACWWMNRMFRQLTRPLRSTYLQINPRMAAAWKSRTAGRMIDHMNR